MTPSSFARQVTAVVLAVAGIWACSSDANDGVPNSARGELGAACSFPADCEEGLECGAGHCRVPCTNECVGDDPNDVPDGTAPLSDGGVSDASAHDAEPDADTDAGDPDAGPPTDPDPVGPLGTRYSWNGSYDLPTNGVCSVHGWCGPYVNTLHYAWGSSWVNEFDANRDVWFAGATGPSGGDAILHYKGGKLTGLTGFPRGNTGPISGSGPNDVWIGKLHYDGVHITVNPKPPPGTATWFAAQNDAWSIAGATAWHWDGADWTAMPNGAAGSLSAVVGFASNDVWAVGGTELRHWDGVAWNGATVPMPAGATGSFIGGTSSTNLWVADGTFVYRFDGATWTAYNITGTVLAIGGTATTTRIATTQSIWLWDGSRFGLDLSGGRAYEGVCGVACGKCLGAWVSPSSANLLAVGELGPPGSGCTTPIRIVGGSLGTIYIDNNSSQTTYAANSPLLNTQTRDYVLVSGKPNWSSALWGITNLDKGVAISGTADNDIWISGTSQSAGVASHWNGATFKAYPLAYAATSAVSITSANVAWVLTKTATAAPGSSFFDGATWTQQPGPAAGYATSIWGSSATDAWSTGDSGCQHWDGIAWTTTACGIGKGFRIVGTSPADVWVFGVTGAVVHFNGAGWYAKNAGPAGGAGSPNLVTISIAAWNDVWASDGPHLMHFDGAKWQVVETGFGYPLAVSNLSFTAGWGRFLGKSYPSFSQPLVMTKAP